MVNDKVETHRLSCPLCNTSFNAKGKMAMEIICPHCTTFLNVKVHGAFEEEQEKT